MVLNPSSDKANRSGNNLSNPWFYALLAIFLLAAFFGARLLNDADLGYHLKGGQWILQNHAFPGKDTYTSTVPDHDYLDMHWLYQVCLYLLYLGMGYKGLVVANILLIGTALFLLYRRIFLSGVDRGMGVILLVLALLGCELRFRVRPEIVTWVLLGATLLILDERVRRGRNGLLLLPLLQLVWVNVEGLFILGPLVTGIYLASSYAHEKKIDKDLLKYGGFSLLACLVNPYFLKGALFPFMLLQSLGTSSVFKESINEFRSPWTMGDASDFAPFWTLGTYKVFTLFILILLLATFRKRRLHEFLLVGVFLYLSAVAQRNIALFFLVAMPVAGACWRDITWNGIRGVSQKFFSSPFVPWALVLFVLALCLRVGTNAYYVSERRFDRFGLGLDEMREPEKAAEFLTQNQLNGRMLNHLDLGGWLDWRGPTKTFIDGRLEVMGEDLFTEYRDSLKPGGLDALLMKYPFDILVVNPTGAAQWLYSLHSRPDWRPVYLDETVAIFLKKGYAPRVPELDGMKVLTEKGIRPMKPEEILWILQSPRPSVMKGFVEDFFHPSNYPQGLNEVGSYFWFGTQYDLAEAVFLEALRRTQGRFNEVYLNLGNVYFNAGDYEKARLCMSRVLEVDPGSRKAQFLLSRIP